MKKFLLFFLGLIVLLVGAVAVFLLTFDLNSYRELISEQATEALGRPVKIGELSMKLSLIPTIKAQDIEVVNPDGFASDKPLLKVDTLDATLAIVPLFSRRIEVQSITFGTVDINLIEQSEHNNWTLGRSQRQMAPAVADSENSWLSQIRIDDISAKTVNLNYQRNESKQKLLLTDMSLKQLKVFSLTVTFNSIPFKVSGTVNSLLDLIAKKPDYLFNIDIIGADTLVKLSGSIGNTETFRKLLLNVTASGDSLKQVLERFGIESRSIPAQAFTSSIVLQGETLASLQIDELQFVLGGNKLKADLKGEINSLTADMKTILSGTIVLADRALGQLWGLQPFSADVSMTLTPSKLTVDNLSVIANRSDLQASGVAYMDNGKLNLEARVVSEYLDIQDLFYTESSGYVAPMVGDAQQEFVIPDRPVRLDALNQLNAAVTFVMPHMKVSDSFDGYLGLAGTLQLNKGYLVVNPLRVEILDGQIDGAVQVRTVQDRNDFKAQLIGKNLQLDQVKSVAKLVKGASIDFDLDLQASGNSVRSILSTLTGHVSAEVPQGTIMNEWFNSQADRLGITKITVTSSTTDRESKILCAGMNLDVQDGEIKGEDSLAIETSTVNFIAGGSVNLAKETMNLKMIPSVNIDAKTANDLMGLIGRFIRISGTFSAPRPDIDKDEALQSAVIGAVKLMQNKELSSTVRIPTYQLCQQVLKRQPQGLVRMESRKNRMLPKPVAPVKAPEVATPKTFQEQLMEAVSEVLR